MMMGWLLFYFTDLSMLLKYLSVMFNQSGNQVMQFEFLLVLKDNMFWLLMAVILCMPVYPSLQKFYLSRKKIYIWQYYLKTVVVIGMSLCFLFCSTALLVGKNYNAFLYMRF